MADNRKLFILSGPSGTGKATMLEYVTSHAHIHRVVTYTTRKPRPSEKDGVDYHFVSPERFEELFADGTIIERERVYGDFFYGSPRDVFGDDLSHAIMELDTVGAETYRGVHENVVTIFILPPSIDELVRRIESRHREANFANRLRKARPMLEHARSYDHLVVNDCIEDSGRRIIGIVDNPEDSRDYSAESALIDSLLEEVEDWLSKNAV